MKRSKPDLWSGDICISEGMMVFIGLAGDNSVHSHATLQLTVSHSGPLQLEDDSGTIFEGEAIYTRPGIKHALLNSSKVTLVLIEPHSSIARCIMSLCASGPIGSLPDDVFSKFSANDTAADVIQNLKGLVLSEYVEFDPRLKQALLFLRNAPLKNAIKNAATICELSEPRLRAISTQNLDIPLSKWVLWCAIARASNAISQGESLAEAAVTGGFSDQAHYTRTLHTLMVITPGKIKHLIRDS